MIARWHMAIFTSWVASFQLTIMTLLQEPMFCFIFGADLHVFLLFSSPFASAALNRLWDKNKIQEEPPRKAIIFPIICNLQWKNIYSVQWVIKNPSTKLLLFPCCPFPPPTPPKKILWLYIFLFLFLSRGTWDKLSHPLNIKKAL